MDKKNTMLLTVIAVATLLVAVVGATFAFFTATNEASGSTTVTATTELVGAVTISNPATAMHINLKAIDMAIQTQGTPYYATVSAEPYVRAIEYQSVSQVAVTGGESTTQYSCSYKLNVTASDVLETGDATVTFRTETVQGVSDLVIDGVTSGQEIDLVTARGKSYNVSFKVEGNIPTATTLISAGFELNNLEAEQDHLREQDLSFGVTNSGMSCTVLE